MAPGKGNLSPQLTLQYSSQAPNGVFGVGWSLSGVSSITRCAKSPVEDGDRIGVKNDATDLFCLDGQKLRAVSGFYGAVNTQYRTAIDIYGRITSLGDVAGGPQSFTLETKTGVIYTFGGTSDSRLEHPGKAIIRTWMVSEIKDRYNNRISFTYSKNLTLGEQLLTRVDYSNGRVQLQYEPRPTTDPIVKYDDGVEYGSTNSRVGTVTISHLPLMAGTPTLAVLSTYQLQYSQSAASSRSMLKYIRQCAVANACLPAVTFNYADSMPATLFASGLSNLPVSQVPHYVVRQPDGKDRVRNLWSIHQTLGYVWDPFSGGKSSGPLLWDIDGDGATDFEMLTWQEYDGNASGHQRRTWLSSTGHVTVVNENPASGRCYADLNGDGLSEVYTSIGSYYDGNLTAITVNEPLHRSSILIPRSGDEYSLVHNCRPVDVNGDGRADTFVGRRALSVMNGGLQLGPNILSSADSLSSRMFPGDFNGDGKTDFAHFYWDPMGGAGGAISMDTSRGSLTATFLNSTVLNFTLSLRCVGDFNGDGRSDALLNDRIMLSNGAAMTSRSTSFVSLAETLCGDFNGDGLTDFFYQGVHYLNMLPAHVDRLVEVNNGAGFVQQVQYKPITDNSVYTKGSAATYPQIDMQVPIIVVSIVRAGSEAQGWNSNSYGYAALRADLRRDGTQGFERVTSADLGTGISVTTHYNQRHPLTGKVARVHKFVGSEAAPQTLENTFHGYLVRPNATLPEPQGAQVHLDQSTTSVFDLRQPGVLVGTQRKVVESVDLYGFPVREKTESLDATGGVTSVSTATHEYNHQIGPWLLGQLVKSVISAQNLSTLPSTVTPPMPLTVQVTPTEVVASLTAPGPWSAVLSATVAGGVGPYTYDWMRTVGTRTAVVNANIASPTVSATLAAGDVFNETLRVRVTDAIGGTVFRDVVVRYVTPFPFSPTINANTSNYNLRAAAVAAGWNQTSPLRATVTVYAGVMLSANAVTTYGFDTGTGFPAGTTLALINNGSIIGMGGAGGVGSNANSTPAAGQTGGPALSAQTAVTVTNNGTIGGGGTGGWGGVGWEIETSGGCCAQFTGPRGGGGRSGATNSAGGNQGTAAAAGAGVTISDEWSIRSVSQPGGPYGGGPAVVGNANIVWQSAGTRLGALN